MLSFQNAAFTSRYNIQQDLRWVGPLTLVALGICARSSSPGRSTEAQQAHMVFLSRADELWTTLQTIMSTSTS